MIPRSLGRYDFLLARGTAIPFILDFGVYEGSPGVRLLIMTGHRPL